jgi:cbb3-type cytochrome oxidase subunit 3
MMVKVIFFTYLAVMLALAAGVIAWVISVVKKKRKAQAEEQNSSAA